MAAYGFSTNLTTNVKVAGISSIVLEKNIAEGAAADTIDTLTQFRDGKLVINTLGAKNKTGMITPVAFEAKASWIYQRTTTAMIEVLDALTTGGIGPCNLALQNGDNFIMGAAGHILASGAIKWKIVYEGDTNAERYIEMELKRRAPLSHASLYDLDYGWGTYTPVNISALLPTVAAADYKPAGFRTFGVRNTGESTFETVGPIRNGKMTLELLCTEDTQGRYVSLDTIMVNVEAEVMDTTPTSLAVLDTFSEVISNDYEIAMMDGQVWTFADNLGIEWAYSSENDMQDAAFLKFMGSGIIKLSDLDGIVA